VGQLSSFFLKISTLLGVRREDVCLFSARSEGKGSNGNGNSGKAGDHGARSVNLKFKRVSLLSLLVVSAREGSL